MDSRRTEQPVRDLETTLQGLLSGETDALALSANFVAALFHGLDEVNWLGLYVRRGEELVLGPFQGRPACIRIPMGRGVCGKAALDAETLCVPDVHRYADHIVCDPDSRSEVVVPLTHAGRVFAVLDVDSPVVDRFRREDVAFLERAGAILVGALGENALSL